MSTTNKRILFEGQDVSMSSTMRKLMGTAEEMHKKNLEGVSKEIAASKSLKKELEDQINQKERGQRIGQNNAKMQIEEEFRQRKQLAEAFERDEEERLRKRGLKGKALEDALGKYRSDVTDPKRAFADEAKSFKTDELSKQTAEQKTTNELLREILNQDTKQWEQEVREDKKNVEHFVKEANKTGIDNLPPEQRAKALYQQALLSEQKPEEKSQRASILKDILGAGLIRDFGSILGQMPSARDGYDLIPAITRMSGAIGGAGIGAGAGLLALNPTGGATVGAEVGQRAGEIAGSALARHLSERENLEKSSLGVRAVTGSLPNSASFSKFGVSSSEGFQIAKEMALRSGSGQNNVMDLLGVETGYGIERGSLMESAKATRRTGKEFGSSLSNLLGTAKGGNGIEGIDRVLFNELVQGQTQLINSIGSMTEKVDPKNITAIMMEMNTLGGGFSAKDPRSMGFIQALHSGLTNTNEFGQAMNLSVLRKMDPNAGLVDLLEMEEQGYGGKKGREFLKNTVGQYSEMYNDEDLVVLSLRDRFPGIPISDLRRLARGEDVLGSMDTKQMNAGVDLQGEGNVSTRSIMQAEVTDAFAVGAVDGMKMINSQMADLFAEALEQALKQVGETVGTKKVTDAVNLGSRIINIINQAF